MPRADITRRRFHVGSRKMKASLPVRLQKKVTDQSPQLVLPNSGQTISVVIENEVVSKMTVIARASWVSGEKSGAYQVKVRWNESEASAYWDKIKRKWFLIPPSLLERGPGVRSSFSNQHIFKLAFFHSQVVTACLCY